RRGVAANLLQEDREDEDTAIEPEAQHRAESDAGGEAAVLEHAQVDDWLGSPQFPGDEEHDAKQRQDRQPADEVRLEPVLAVPLLENGLQAAQPQSQQRDPRNVDPLASRL